MSSARQDQIALLAKPPPLARRHSRGTLCLRALASGGWGTSPLVWHRHTITKRVTHNEMLIHPRLRHPSIVPVLASRFEVRTIDMPIAWGGDLVSIFACPEEFQFNAAAHTGGIARQVAHALTYLHAQGVYHLDVKLDNLLLPDGRYQADGDTPRVWLADFGTACFRDGRLGGKHRRMGQVGTPQYAPPELYHHATRVGTPAMYRAFDTWLFGILVYCLWVGEGLLAPYQRALWKHKSLRAIQAEIDDILAQPACASMPPHLAAVVTAALRADWQARPSMFTISRVLAVCPLPKRLQTLHHHLRPPPHMRPSTPTHSPMRLMCGASAAGTRGDVCGYSPSVTATVQMSPHV